MEIEIDLASVKNKEDLHALLKNILDFPDYYGRNLDALFDFLTEPHELYEICFKNTASAEDALGGYFYAFKQTFADAEEESSFVKSTWC